ncbi:MAG: hypothetical protein M1824_000447 [Vezdaea acicularis]|nr:MAG: hypothetical protein M1824_000447 [Vezdaea acicularis]
MPLPNQPSVSKPFSISLGSKAPPKSSPLSRKPLLPPKASTQKRPHSSLGDDDSDAEDTPPKAEIVLGFDHAVGGAITSSTSKTGKGPLVIPGQKNKDWRQESRKRRGGKALPHEANAAQAEAVSKEADIVNGGPQVYGLTFVKATTTEDDVPMADSAASEAQEPVKSKTDDELALEALMDGTTGRSNLIITSGEQDKGKNGGDGRAGYGINEDEAFRADVEARPDSATLDQYAAVPVEEFGMALLRGMGWKEGEVVGKRKGQISKARVVERRPALLGIGAKEMPELNGKEVGVKKGIRKTKEVYNPVLLRNSKTGELVTEEELRERKERRREGDSPKEAERDRYRDRDRDGNREIESGKSKNSSRDSRRDDNGARSRGSDRDGRRSDRRDRNRDRDRDRDLRGDWRKETERNNHKQNGWRDGEESRSSNRERDRARDSRDSRDSRETADRNGRRDDRRHIPIRR